MSGEPPRPRKVDPEVPRDLETIVLKAIERNPAERYASAGELAEDLRRFLEDRPIRARRCARRSGPGAGPGATRRWRRSSVCVLVLLATLAVGSTLAAVWLNAERNRAIDHLWGAYLAQAHAGRASLLAGQRFTSLDVLIPPRPGSASPTSCATRPSPALALGRRTGGTPLREDRTRG